jgi:acetyltransferase-like isoleucine patch superfamily enzyme
MSVIKINKKNTKFYHPHLSNIHENAKIGSNCVIHSHVWIGAKARIGNDCKIQAQAFIPDLVSIGNKVFIGPAVVFTNDKKPMSGGKFWQKTVVKDDVIIGARAVIGPGVRLGKGCFIGMGAVVTKNVPAGEVWVGNPAKSIREARSKSP